MEDSVRQVAAYRASMSGLLGEYRNGKSSAELEAERRAADEARRRQIEAENRRRAEEERKAREAEELRIAREAEAARKAAEENQKLIDRLLGNSKQIRDIPLTNTDYTKYRIITPVKYRQVGSKLVPAVRYESVRELSPEAVSSLVYRGYEVQSVDPSTPLSSQKAYGPSVVAHASKTVPISGIRGITQIRGRRAEIAKAESERRSYRRVIR